MVKCSSRGRQHTCHTRPNEKTRRTRERSGLMKGNFCFTTLKHGGRISDVCAIPAKPAQPVQNRNSKSLKVMSLSSSQHRFLAHLISAVVRPCSPILRRMSGVVGWPLGVPIDRVSSQDARIKKRGIGSWQSLPERRSPFSWMYDISATFTADLERAIRFHIHRYLLSRAHWTPCIPRECSSRLKRLQEWFRVENQTA